MRKVINNAVVVTLVTILLVISVCAIPISIGPSSGTEKAYATTLGTLGTDCTAELDNGILTISATPSSATIDSHSAIASWPWYSERGKINKVVFEGNVSAAGDLVSMFDGMENLTEIEGISNLDTSNATDMAAMFAHCKKLTGVDLQGFDTSSVKNMANMFLECESLTELNLSTFDTADVTGFNQMFKSCYLLENITFSPNLNSEKVTNMKDMFSGCRSLTELDLSNFDTRSTTDMDTMFYGCSDLVEFTLGSGFAFLPSANDPYPPSPSGTAITGFYTGKWENTDGDVFDRDKIPSNTYDTYTAEILPVTLSIQNDDLNIGTTFTAVLTNSEDEPFTYQWSRSKSPDSGFENIDGATLETYVSQEGDAGYYLRCTATYENISVNDTVGPIVTSENPVPAPEPSDNSNQNNSGENPDSENYHSSNTADYLTWIILMLMAVLALIIILIVILVKKNKDMD